ncbi:MAG: tetratricopeptide repeat protein [Eubacteriaceae bacterium]
MAKKISKIDKNEDRKYLSKIVRLFKKYKIILLIFIAVLIISIIVLQIIAYSYKQCGYNLLKNEIDLSTSVVESLNSVYLVDESEQLQKNKNNLGVYNDTLDNYENSRRYSPLFVSVSDINYIKDEISTLEAEIDLGERTNLIHTEIETNDLSAAKTNIYSAIDFANNNQLETDDLYYTLATILSLEQENGDPADGIIFALNKANSNLYDQTIKEMLSNNLASRIMPNILNIYGKALNFAKRDDEAIIALNQSLKNLQEVSASSSKDSLLAEAYYYLASSYWRTNEQEKALESINNALKIEPTNESILNYKTVITFLMQQ